MVRDDNFVIVFFLPVLKSKLEDSKEELGKELKSLNTKKERIKKAYIDSLFTEKEFKEEEEEEERRAPFPSKYLRQGSSGPDYIKVNIEKTIYLFSPQHFFIPTRNQLLPLSHTQRDSCRAASPPVKSLIHLIPSPSPPLKTKPPRALLPLGASEAYRCATRAPEHTAPENGDTFLIEKNGRIEETAGVRGDSHGQAARRTSLFPHSSRTD